MSTTFLRDRAVYRKLKHLQVHQTRMTYRKEPIIQGMIRPTHLYVRPGSMSGSSSEKGVEIKGFMVPTGSMITGG
jgi:hypothetical protein